MTASNTGKERKYHHRSLLEFSDHNLGRAKAARGINNHCVHCGSARHCEYQSKLRGEVARERPVLDQEFGFRSRDKRAANIAGWLPTRAENNCSLLGAL